MASLVIDVIILPQTALNRNLAAAGTAFSFCRFCGMLVPLRKGLRHGDYYKNHFSAAGWRHRPPHSEGRAPLLHPCGSPPDPGRAGFWSMAAGPAQWTFSTPATSSLWRPAITAHPWYSLFPVTGPFPSSGEDGHLLVVDKPAGMTAHASNFLPDTPYCGRGSGLFRGDRFYLSPGQPAG